MWQWSPKWTHGFRWTPTAIGAQPPKGRALDVGYTSPRSMICVCVNNGNPHVDAVQKLRTTDTSKPTEYPFPHGMLCIRPCQWQNIFKNCFCGCLRYLLLLLLLLLLLVRLLLLLLLLHTTTTATTATTTTTTTTTITTTATTTTKFCVV